MCGKMWIVLLLIQGPIAAIANPIQLFNLCKSLMTTSMKPSSNLTKSHDPQCNYYVNFRLLRPACPAKLPAHFWALQAPRKAGGTASDTSGFRRFKYSSSTLNPKAQNGPKALYSMVFGPKSLKIWVLRALGLRLAQGWSMSSLGM